MPTFNPPRCGECGNHKSPYSKFVHPQGDAQRNIRPEIYKLSSMVSLFNNARLKKLRKLTIASERPESFFKVRKDTPRGENMLGSLVVVVPNRHEGEAHYQGEKWDFDCSAITQAQQVPFTASIAFDSDVEHEVSVGVSRYPDSQPLF